MSNKTAMLRNILPALLLCAAALLTARPAAGGEEKEEENEKKGPRLILLEPGDPTPTDFHHRQGPRGIIRRIDTFRKKLPEEHKAKIVVEKFFNMNYGKVDDRIARMVPLDEKDRRDGTELIFRKGRLHREVPWVEGVRHGTETVYGTRRRKPAKTVPWKKGKVHGEVKTYYPDGKVMSEASYVDGKLQGLSKSYSPEGKVIKVVPYRNGKRHGTMVDYWPKTGKKKKIVPCVEGKVEGTAKLYYEDGTLKAEIPFRNDSRHGIEKTYDEDGKLERRRYWLDGELVPEGVFEEKYEKD